MNEHIEEALKTLERAQEQALENLAGGDVSYVNQLKQSNEGIKIIEDIKAT